MKLEKLSDKVIKFSFYLLFILVPLILTPWNYELFEFNKMVVTYALTAVIIGAWIVKMAVRGKVEIAKTPLDIPIGLFVFSQFLSSIYSMDPHVSWFGYYSRFNGGMWSIIVYTLLFYAFVSNFVKKDEAGQNSNIIIKFLNVILITAALVSVYAVLERLGIDKHLWVQDVQNRVFSTLGQPNWLAAYLVSVVPLSMMFAVKNANGIQQKSKKFISLIFSYITFPKSLLNITLSGLFFFVILNTRSRAGLIGFGLSQLLLWIILLFKSKSKKTIASWFVFFNLLFFIIIFFNGTFISGFDKWFTFKGLTSQVTSSKEQTPATAQPQVVTGTLLEYGGTESGTIRKYVWSGALRAWQESTKTLLIGTGTETFAWAFFRHRPREHNLTSEWDFLYNKAHNEYLNYLTTTGLVGLLTYFLLIIIFLIWIIKALFSQPAEKHNKLLTIGLIGGWSSILVTNFFGFSVVAVQIFFYLFPAFMIILNTNFESQNQYRLSLPKWSKKTIPPTIAIITLMLLLRIFTYWKADTYYAKGYRFNRSDTPNQAKIYLEKALSLNAGEPNYINEYANALSQVSFIAANENNATAASALAQESANLIDKAISISPMNVSFWKTRTKILHLLSALNPQLAQKAIDSLLVAHELSPNDAKILYNLAILYGHEEKYDQALEYLFQAKEIKPNYRDAYYGLYVFYNELGDEDKAEEKLTEYLEKVDPNDQDFLQRLNRQL